MYKRGQHSYALSSDCQCARGRLGLRPDFLFLRSQSSKTTSPREQDSCSTMRSMSRSSFGNGILSCYRSTTAFGTAILRLSRFHVIESFQKKKHRAAKTDDYSEVESRGGKSHYFHGGQLPL